MAASRAALAALDAAAAPTRDVVLFRHDRSRFCRLLGLFCTGQSIFWTYLAHFAFTALRPKPEPPDGPDDPLRPRDQKWRLGFTASCLTLGCVLLASGLLFPLRVVGRVTLLRGGTRVTIGTHGPLGWGQGPQLTVPLSRVSCPSHRSQVAAALPLKVKGRPFYFLLDKGGDLPDPRLFDLTVGAYRKL